MTAPCLGQQDQAASNERAHVQQDVNVRLQYLKDDPIYKKQKPLQITPNFLDTEKKTNVGLAPGQPETIHDVRGRMDQFSLDSHGFQYVHAPTSLTEWASQPKIAKAYLPDLEQLLKREVAGCDEIIFYDARIRHSDEAGLRIDGLSYNPFARQVHTDNTEKSVLHKIRNLTEIKADYLLSGRARIINIWRPIKHPVYDCGLAVADGGKLRQDDVIECDRHRHDTNEFWDTMGVIQYRPGFEWYYMSEQDEQDVLLFKTYDSDTGIKTRTCLHTAFDLPSVPENAPTRESIEVRALIFTYPTTSQRPFGAWTMPQPLAESLEQGHLKRVDVEHNITDCPRNDIDEGNEIKAAMLLLRKQEIQRLETELEHARKQISIYGRWTEALQSQIRDLNAKLKQSEFDLRLENQGLRAQLVDVQLRHGHVNVSDDERTILHQQLERAQYEVQKWRAEAMGYGNDAVSRVWQGSVDEAIRREREKDAVVINSLRAELEGLRIAQAS